MGSDTLVTRPDLHAHRVDTNFEHLRHRLHGGLTPGPDYTISTTSRAASSVTTATVTITAENQTKVYGTADPTFT